MTHHTPTTWTAMMFCAGAMALAATLPAQPTVQWMQGAVEDYEDGSKRQQKKQAQELRDAVATVENAGIDGQRVAAADGRERLEKKARKVRTKRSRKKAPARGDAPRWQFPETAGYVFGPAVVSPMAGKRAEVQRAERTVPVQLALLGMSPEADLAVAALLARLDSDRSADDFGLFLDRWRNGDETFYEALDRTAGTSNGVFFYDAMLGDFVEEFARGRDAASKALRKSHDASHAALHQAFLTYRQYRAFREAVALSLVLPPDVPLPAHLARYEQVSSGYSLRDMVTMVLAVHDYDPAAVVDAIVATAAPLPSPLWSASYDPFERWSEVFDGAMEEMLRRSNHTDEFLRLAVSERMQQAQQVRSAACAALGVTPMAAGY